MKSTNTKPAFSFNQLLFILGAAALVFLLAFSPADADSNTAFNQAFLKSFNHPEDVEAAMSYAEEAVKIGDYESAIPPLERILMFNPELSDVRLEVGVLYYLLNSNAVAKKHLELVSYDSNASLSTRQRAKSYLEKL